MNILIADDEKFMREDLKKAVERVRPGNSYFFAENFDSAVKAVEGIFAVQASAPDADDAAALGHHRRVTDGLGALRDHGGEAHGIGGQHADVVEILSEQRHELFQARGDRVEVGGKSCFHDVASFHCFFAFYSLACARPFFNRVKPRPSAEDACVFL